MGEPAVNGEVQCWKCSMTVGSSFASRYQEWESLQLDSDGVVKVYNWTVTVL